MAEQPPLGEVFLAACAEHTGRRAVVDADQELSYGQLAERVRDRARTLVDLLGPDEHRIALHAANSADYLVSYYALLIAGRLPFLVDSQFGATELQGIRDSCGVDTFLTDKADHFPLPSGLVPVPGSRHVLARPARPGTGVEPPGPRPTTATCRFTSGTTGAPKCLEFSHTAVHSAALNWTTGTGLGAGDRVLCLAAFTNGLAFNTSLLPVFLVGAELHVYRGLPTSSGITKALRRSAATRLVAFPLAYRLLAETPAPDLDAFSDLRLAVSAAAVLDPAVRESFESRYHVRIADYYGIAETGPCTFERDPEYAEGLGTALPGVSLRILPREDGESEVRVRTASMATCYLNVPDGLEERLDTEGYYRTGDRGLIHQDRLYVTGRLGGPVNLAGRKVDPAEIERVVLGIDGVRDTAVFADQDARGETVLHAVVCGSLARADVVDVCRTKLAPYKVPGRITFLPAIPRSSAGKVRLTELRDLVTRTP
ncbi:AMP-binding protein [Streptomyces sp. SID4919]|uniref:class I adenylate-forming enzyme family protein n=1 Tax=unclassified Streptomyces TaxID=2593676 RepID=UPI000823BEE4|nr:class I adenylate-forming enzyme family protein [Streptomyces sp. AmelKG-E11A]MYY09547.1 AMP-binding protein [Streptomyces sp. SID4919]SCK63019.1 Acyl-CoA synthetase (AMP-forming)/AMP-acid ligase II [Streptomyces sp. AmelKG-E11A]